VAPFKGEKMDVLVLMANVDTAFEVMDPRNECTLIKFVLMRISGEPRTATEHRNKNIAIPRDAPSVLPLFSTEQTIVNLLQPPFLSS
jgi:hypothetical protein